MKLIPFCIMIAVTVLLNGCDDYSQKVKEREQKVGIPMARELSREPPNSPMRYTEIGKELIRKYPEETKYRGDGSTTGTR